MNLYPVGTRVKLSPAGIREVNQYHRSVRRGYRPFLFENLADENTEGVVTRWEGIYDYSVDLSDFPKDVANNIRWYFTEDMLRPAEDPVPLSEDKNYLQALNIYKQEHPDFDPTDKTPEDVAEQLSMEGYLQVEPWFIHGLARLPKKGGTSNA
jgi:hypothetical protein